MGAQLALVPWPTNGVREPVLPEGVTRLEKEFLEYHARHPEVWRLFCLATLRLIASGRTHDGAKRVIENLRFDTRAGDMSPERAFKIPNSATTHYARTFAKTYCEYENFFSFAKGRAA